MKPVKTNKERKAEALARLHQDRIREHKAQHRPRKGFCGLSFDPWLHIPRKIYKYAPFTLIVALGLSLGFLGMCSCVVTFRSKTQKTTEKEVQLGLAGPGSEFSQSQIGAKHIHEDTLVKVRVTKDTTYHIKDFK